VASFPVFWLHAKIHANEIACRIPVPEIYGPTAPEPLQTAGRGGLLSPVESRDGWKLVEQVGNATPDGEQRQYGGTAGRVENRQIQPVP
jgi:hypothetical protein